MVERTEVSFQNTTCDYVGISGQWQSTYIKNSSTIGVLSLSNRFVNNFLHSHHTLIKESTCKSIQLNNFNCGHFFITEKSKVNQLEIEHSIIGDFWILDSSVNQSNLTGSHCSFILEDTALGSFRSEHTVFTDLTFKGEINGKFYFEESNIGSLSLLQTALVKESILSISSSKINRIKCDQLLATGQLQLKEVSASNERHFFMLGEHLFRTPTQEDFSWLLMLGWNNKDCNVADLTKNGTVGFDHHFEVLSPQLEIYRSSMGKTEFIGCDLSDYQLMYCNSKLLDMFFAGSNLPKNDKNIHIKKNSLENFLLQDELSQKISLYVQLKKVFDSQGNITEGNYYHSRAMYYQQKLLSLQLKNNWGKKEGRLDLLSDWFTYKLNRYSNNHGESWWRAIRFIFIVIPLTFIPAVWSLKYHFSYSSLFTLDGWQFLTDWNLIWENRSKLPGFFLPTHKIDYLAEGTSYSPGLVHAGWDVIGRIFIGYGIYQFISAFRRHSRKGA